MVALQSLGLFDTEKSNTIVVNSLSKNFGMSGWRLGYALGNPALINQMLKANQHIITCPPTILQQYIARHFHDILAITKPQIEVLARKREQVVAYLRRWPRVLARYRHFLLVRFDRRQRFDL